MAQTDSTISLATKLATSYLGNNKVAREDLPGLIGRLHETLTKLESGEIVCEPAVPVDKSVKQNQIILL